MSLPPEFQKFPSHWDVLPFPQAVKDATSGNIKIQKNQYIESGNIPVVDQGQSLYGGFTDDESSRCRSELPAIVFGDHTRIFKYIEESFAIGADGVKILEPLGSLDKRFLFHYLKQLKIESAGYSRHFKFLKETYIPVPPLAEQKRIAAILDKADAIRRKRQQATQLADDFLRVTFMDMFGDPVKNPKGWSISSLTLHGALKNGLNFGKGEAGSSLRYLGVGDFKSLSSINDMRTLKTIQLNKVPAKDYLLKDGDLVFVRSNGNKALVGRCITVYPNNEPLTFSGFCIRYRVSSDIEPEYLNYLFRTPSMKQKMLKGGQGANIQNINQKILSALAIPLPPVVLQKKFCNIVKSYKDSMVRFDSASKDASNMLVAISKKAFLGEL